MSSADWLYVRKSSLMLASQRMLHYLCHVVFLLVICNAPPTIEHGYALNENNTFVGDQVNYTCDADYVFNSNYDVICQATGNWSVAPICRHAGKTKQYTFIKNNYIYDDIDLFRRTCKYSTTLPLWETLD